MTLHLKWLIAIALFLSSVDVSKTQNPLSCDTAKGWFNLDNDKCYKVFWRQDERSWHRASEVCHSYGSQLVTVMDQYENDALGSRVQQLAGNRTSYWIGLARRNTAGCTACERLQWSGNLIVANNEGFWGDGQPNSQEGNCVFSYKNMEDYAYDRPFVWRFDNCNLRRAFVCERMAAPSGSFHCFSGGFVNSRRICDGRRDCADGSDELNCQSRCSHFLQGSNGVLTPFIYQSPQNCIWAIETPLGTNAYIEFSNFQTENQADFATVYAGSIIEARATRVARLTGNEGTNRQFRSYNNMMLVKFTSDAMVEAAGFSARYDSFGSQETPVVNLRAVPAVQTYNLNQFTVGGVQNFLGMNDYVIVISTQRDCKQIITLEITSLDLHDSDEVIFFDGDSAKGAELAKMCNNGCTNYDVVYSTGETMSILLRTQMEMSKNLKFSFRYRQGCYYETTKQWGTLFTPGYPGGINYPNNIECTWKINTPSPVTLLFSDDLGIQDDDYNRINNGDYLQVFDDGTAMHPAPGFTTSDLRTMGTIVANNNSLELRFNTSPSRSDRGFIATWSIGCGDPMFDVNTVVTPPASSYHYTSVVSVSCALGYMFQQQQIMQGTLSIQLECSYMGKWNYNQVPRCTSVYCGDVPDIPNGYIVRSSGSIYQSVATYRCYPGSSLVGQENITCQASGAWSQSPTCIAESCNAGQISLNILNGMGNRTNGDGSQIGSVVTYECNDGYEIDGDPIILCQENGEWSSLTPTCRPLTCRLPDIPNGVYQNNQIGNFIDYLGTAFIQCNPGYTYANDSDRRLMCKSDRTFDGNPQCVNENECLRNPCDGPCEDTEGSFKCSCLPGYELIPSLGGSPATNCQDINECGPPDISGCHQGCLNTMGSYMCQCDSEYVLYTAPGTAGYDLPQGETGLLPTDTYYINHTCVLKQCSAPPAVGNVGDFDVNICPLGTELTNGNLIRKCNPSGAWSGSSPTCVSATCPNDFVTAQNPAAFNSGPYAYGEKLYLNCTVGNRAFSMFRHCTYNTDTDVYELQGSPYECGVIDCGEPTAYPGTNYSPVINTRYQSAFTFTCSSGRVFGTSQQGDTTVRCQENGYWDFGNLRCLSDACLDPGFPAGGSIIATSFSDNSEVKFSCDRNGYSLTNDVTLVCSGSAFLGGSVPQCIDTTQPTIIGCPTGSAATIRLPRYSRIADRLPSISVTDNTGIESFTVSPSNANTTLVLAQDLTVTYTVRDYANNVEVCNINFVVLDETPPTLNCPSVTQLDLETTASTLSYEPIGFTYNDNVDGSQVSFTVITPPPTTYSIQDLYRTFTYEARATDSRNNQALCKSQVFVKPAVCSELSFPTPLFATKSCTFTGVTRTCVITCNDAYTFETSKSITVSCTNGVWSRETVPACIQDTTAPMVVCPASETIRFTTTTDERTVDFSILSRTVTDTNDINSVTFEPSSKLFTVGDLYSTTQVTMRVVDKANNQATCAFQYLVLPQECSPLSLPRPVFGQENQCSRRNTFGNPGYDCTVTCNDGYILRGIGKTTTLSCSDGSSWSTIHTACIIDTTAPTLTCPQSRTLTINDGNTVLELDFTDENSQFRDYTANDVGGIDRVEYIPSRVQYDQNNVNGQAQTIVVRAYDLRGNFADCSFQIVLLAPVCSPLSLPDPQNGFKTCSATGTGWFCTLQCSSGFVFYDTLATTINTTCSTGNPFDRFVPGCVNVNDAPSQQFIGTLRYRYVPADGTLTIPATCVDGYISQQTLLRPGTSTSNLEDMAGKLRELCLPLIDPPSVTVSFTNTVGRILSDGRTLELDYDYTMGGASVAVYLTCSQSFGANINLTNTALQLNDNIFGNGVLCPEVQWASYAVQTQADFFCPEPYYESLQTQDRCYGCPAGTESNRVTCSLCPIGKYRSFGTFGGCQDCPTGYTTRNVGATSSNQCVAPCVNGQVSSNGFAPCYSCPVGSYWTSGTTCSSCTPGSTTTGVGASNQNQCVPISTVLPQEVCPLGTEPSGTGTCNLCPEGTYRDSSQSSCIRCPSISQGTYITGATSSQACYNLCTGGLTSSSGQSPCSACPKGTYAVNSTFCQQCPTDQTTVFVGSTSQANCLPNSSRRPRCSRGTYRATDGSCVKCARGFYTATEESTSCSSCPPRESTYIEGATSIEMCFSQCAPGFRSSTGLSPCQPCGVGQYSINSTTCTVCPNGGTTATNTAGSINECINPCPAGQFSFSGYNQNSACRSCPANFYQPSTTSTECLECATNRYTQQSGQTTCLDATPLCTINNVQQRCNNGNCVIEDHTYVCRCNTGYYGRDCQQQVNYCNSNPCYNDGICTTSQTGYTCDCQGRASGFNCETVNNTCNIGQSNPTCKNGGHCVNYAIEPRARCLCPDGYTGSDCTTDTNICLTEPRCNAVGTLRCEDVSNDSNLRKMCVCQPGYEGTYCETNTDDCASTPCINGGTCVDLINSFRCDCRTGYSGPYCEIRSNTCNNKACGDDQNAICVDDYTIDEPRCRCNLGYAYGTYTQYSIMKDMAPDGLVTSVTPLQSRTLLQCRLLCTQQQSCNGFSYRSTTQDCYLLVSLTPNNMVQVLSIDTYTKSEIYPDSDFYTLKYSVNSPPSLGLNRFDSETRTFLNQLELNICGGTEPLDAKCCIKGGSCENLPIGTICDINGVTCNSAACNDVDFEISFKCSVFKVFSDNTCTRRVDYCDSSPCLNGGVCRTVQGGFQCSCRLGYSGSRCQTNDDDCTQSSCNNGGTCVDLVNGFRCDCADGWTGTSCATPVNYCTANSISCNSRGSCQNLQTDYFCNCIPGYEGRDCEREIKRCDSNPCIHGGTCVRLFNNYRCDCPDGWTGVNCQELVQNCNIPATGGQCNARCLNTFNGYYCQCPANTYGINCENQPDPCRQYNKCQNSAFCSVSNSVMSCTCPTRFMGDGCHILTDHCGLTDNCQNGGVCSLTQTGYTCNCTTGYMGVNCEQDIDECLGITCAGGGTCINDIGRHFCRCPLKMTGNNCAREYDSNYDLYFNMGQAYAWIPYFTEVTGANYVSLSLWVRFAANNGEGVYLTQFKGDRLAGAERFLELTHNGLKVYVPDGLSNYMMLQYSDSEEFNDGNWHLVVVNLDRESGEVFLYLDTVFITSRQHADLIGSEDFKMWVVLGCEFDQNNHRCTDASQFHGYLSQVNWYKRQLYFQRNRGPENIPYLYDFPRHIYDSPMSNLILVWNEYVLESGVSRILPSEAKGARCNVPGRTPQCSSFMAQSGPTVLTCPQDLYLPSPDRIMTVTWTEPTFSNLAGGNVIPPMHQPGSTFSWGKYSIAYVANNPNGDSAYCSFNVFVKSSQCEEPESPIGGRQECTDTEYGRNCVPSCLSPGQYTIDRNHPDVFSCGPSGSWNIAKEFQKIRYPSCGAISSQPPKVRVDIRLIYNITTGACNAARNEINKRIYEEFRDRSQVYTNTLCGNPDCSDIIVNIDCTARIQAQAATTVVDIVIPNADQTTTFDLNTITVEEFMNYYVFGQNMFDYSSTVDSANIFACDSYVIKTTMVCPDSYVVLNDLCVQCGAGNFFRYTDSMNISAICDDCPIGTYQDESGSSSCKTCPGGTTTETTGSSEFSQCKTVCQKGEYFSNMENRCAKCALGYYQDEEGQFYCKFCPAGFTTEFEGTTDAAKCTETCDHGYQLNGTGGCTPCPIDQYRNADLTTQCVNCPNGKIAPREAAKSRDECTVEACSPGSKLNESRNACETCPIGYYQDRKWQTSCIKCGDLSRYSTEETGSTQASDCFYYCPSGFEVESEGVCNPCEIGFYKDNSQGIQGKCVACSGNYRTPQTGSPSAANCTIYKCEVGYQPNAANDGCEACPLGFYQDVQYSTSCKQCTSGQSTRYEASNSSSNCEVYCQSGQQKIGTQCLLCDKGTYKNNVDGLFGTCRDCPSLYTTSSSGSTSVDQCSIRTCPPGTKRNSDDTGCDACPLGSYQPESFKNNCLSCQPNTSTRQVNSTNFNQCETYCPSGQEKIGDICHQCQQGYYKDNNDGLFGECQLCPLTFITDGLGADAATDCNVANCSAGHRLTPNNACEACPKGTYQELKWQNFCNPCGTDKTTELPGADDRDLCILECQPGFEDKQGVCQPCPRGTYKPELAAAACKSCDSGFTTESTGNTAKTACSLPACEAGEYLDRVTDPSNPVCKPCAYDFYQDQIWQEQCKTCPDNKVTLETGVDSVTDCVLNCNSGTQYVAASQTCQQCPRGYYRNSAIRSQSQCQMCDSAFITAAPGATDVNACNIANCSTIGTYRTSANQCAPCPIGYYGTQKWLEQCVQCPAGQSTRETGSTSANDCRRVCPLGEYLDNFNQCQQCRTGTYRSDVNAENCTVCHQGLTTDGPGATSPNQCSRSPCAAGESYDLSNERCSKCLSGTYQPEAGSFSCLECPYVVKYTNREGATSVEECRSQCVKGQRFDEVNKVCEDCPAGTYQPADRQFSCITCPASRPITQGLGSTDINQCLSYCDDRAVNNCSPNATCRLDPNAAEGYTCTCYNNYDSIGSLTGRQCIHKCDNDYCRNLATCIREPSVGCVCTQYYTGNQCTSRIKAQDLEEDPKDIIIPVAIGVSGLILFLIILASCILCWKARSVKKPTRFSDFPNDHIDKSSLHSYSYGHVPYNGGGRLMLAPYPEMMYDNPQFNKGDTAVYQA